MALIGAVALAANIPLGYLREGTRRFSFRWFVYVHLSIPLVAFLRISSHLTPWVIPVFFLCAVGGQVAGGKIRQARRKDA